MNFYKLTYIDYTPCENVVFAKMPEDEARVKAETELTLMLGEGNFQIREFRLLTDEERQAIEARLEEMVPDDSDKAAGEVIEEAIENTTKPRRNEAKVEQE